MQYDTYKHHITIKLINMNIYIYNYIYNMYKHHIYIYISYDSRATGLARLCAQPRSQNMEADLVQQDFETRRFRTVQVVKSYCAMQLQGLFRVCSGIVQICLGFIYDLLRVCLYSHNTTFEFYHIPRQSVTIQPHRLTRKM